LRTTVKVTKRPAAAGIISGRYPHIVRERTSPVGEKPRGHESENDYEYQHVLKTNNSRRRRIKLTLEAGKLTLEAATRENRNLLSKKLLFGGLAYSLFFDFGR
jgi:hypothetical protein